MRTKFVLKRLGSGKATGVWLGASPTTGLISLCGPDCLMFTACLTAELHQKGLDPPGLLQGWGVGPPEVGCTPSARRAWFPSESITRHGAPDVRSGSRLQTLGDVCVDGGIAGCGAVCMWLCGYNYAQFHSGFANSHTGAVPI